MRAIGLKLLKNKLSEYVRYAAAGETVLITDRDQVVAELTPPTPGRSGVLTDALLAEAVRQGWVTPPALSAGESAGPVPAGRPIAKLQAIVGELRQDRDAQ